MITNRECGQRLGKAIKDAGYRRINRDGIYLAFDKYDNQSKAIDTAVQEIIDNFNVLAEAKEDVRERLREQATILIIAIYPVYPKTADARDIYTHLTDCGVTGPRMDAVEVIKDKFLTRRTIINNMTDWRAIDALDVTIGW